GGQEQQDQRPAKGGSPPSPDRDRSRCAGCRGGRRVFVIHPKAGQGRQFPVLPVKHPLAHVYGVYDVGELPPLGEVSLGQDVVVRRRPGAVARVGVKPPDDQLPRAWPAPPRVKEIPVLLRAAKGSGRRGTVGRGKGGTSADDRTRLIAARAPQQYSSRLARRLVGGGQQVDDVPGGAPQVDPQRDGVAANKPRPGRRSAGWKG